MKNNNLPRLKNNLKSRLNNSLDNNLLLHYNTLNKEIFFKKLMKKKKNTNVNSNLFNENSEKIEFFNSIEKSIYDGENYYNFINRNLNLKNNYFQQIYNIQEKILENIKKNKIKFNDFIFDKNKLIYDNINKKDIKSKRKFEYFCTKNDIIDNFNKELYNLKNKYKNYFCTFDFNFLIDKYFFNYINLEKNKDFKNSLFLYDIFSNIFIMYNEYLNKIFNSTKNILKNNEININKLKDEYENRYSEILAKYNNIVKKNKKLNTFPTKLKENIIFYENKIDEISVYTKLLEKKNNILITVNKSLIKNSNNYYEINEKLKLIYKELNLLKTTNFYELFKNYFVNIINQIKINNNNLELIKKNYDLSDISDKEKINFDTYKEINKELKNKLFKINFKIQKNQMIQKDLDVKKHNVFIETDKNMNNIGIQVIKQMNDKSSMTILNTLYFKNFYKRNSLIKSNPNENYLISSIKELEESNLEQDYEKINILNEEIDYYKNKIKEMSLYIIKSNFNDNFLNQYINKLQTNPKFNIIIEEKDGKEKMNKIFRRLKKASTAFKNKNLEKIKNFSKIKSFIKEENINELKRSNDFEIAIINELKIILNFQYENKVKNVSPLIINKYYEISNLKNILFSLILNNKKNLFKILEKELNQDIKNNSILKLIFKNLNNKNYLKKIFEHYNNNFSIQIIIKKKFIEFYHLLYMNKKSKNKYSIFYNIFNLDNLQIFLIYESIFKLIFNCLKLSHQKNFNIFKNYNSLNCNIKNIKKFFNLIQNNLINEPYFSKNDISNINNNILKQKYFDLMEKEILNFEEFQLKIYKNILEHSNIFYYKLYKIIDFDNENNLKSIQIKIFFFLYIFINKNKENKFKENLDKYETIEEILALENNPINNNKLFNLNKIDSILKESNELSISLENYLKQKQKMKSKISIDFNSFLNYIFDFGLNIKLFLKNLNKLEYFLGFKNVYLFWVYKSEILYKNYEFSLFKYKNAKYEEENKILNIIFNNKNIELDKVWFYLKYFEILFLSHKFQELNGKENL